MGRTQTTGRVNDNFINKTFSLTVFLFSGPAALFVQVNVRHNIVLFSPLRQPGLSPHQAYNVVRQSYHHMAE